MARHKRISPVDLSQAITEIFDEYGAGVSVALEQSIKSVSTEAAAKLRQVKQFAPDGNPTGEYSRDWEYTVYNNGRFAVRGSVYNDQHYRLTHLLEFGHVTRNGTGRTFNRTPAYPHIAKVNDWTHDALIADVKKRLGAV